jgi:hypothetical protein
MALAEVALTCHLRPIALEFTFCHCLSPRREERDEFDFTSLGFRKYIIIAQGPILAKVPILSRTRIISGAAYCALSRVANC